MAGDNKSALIAMSGGVDSSVAAYLMKNQGYRCMGITMRLYRNNDIGLNEYHTCCSQKDIDDAGEVAFHLDIPYEVLDFTLDFKERIINKFIRIYESGGVPNPCIDCNRYMKFDRLFDFADQVGLHYVVTGHYARIEYDPEKQLSRLQFPLGEIRKENTREIADSLKFCNAEKHDSQDICFVPDGDYAAFMEQYTGKKYPDGPVVDRTGKTIYKLDFHSGHRNTCVSEGKDQIQTEGTMGDGLSTGGRPDKTHLR